MYTLPLDQSCPKSTLIAFFFVVVQRKIKAYALHRKLSQSQSPIQRNQSYGNLWAVHLHWQKMNGRSC